MAHGEACRGPSGLLCGLWKGPGLFPYMHKHVLCLGTMPSHLRRSHIALLTTALSHLAALPWGSGRRRWGSVRGSMFFSLHPVQYSPPTSSQFSCVPLLLGKASREWAEVRKSSAKTRASHPPLCAVSSPVGNIIWVRERSKQMSSP